MKTVDIVVVIGSLLLLVACVAQEQTMPTTSSPTGTSSPAATPAPTATPMSSEAPTPIPYPEPLAKVGIRTYGGEHNDYLYDILLLADGGTLVAGQANNTGLSHRISPGNAHLIRTDSEGDIIWEKDYGGEADAMLYSLIQVGEDDYVVLGQIAASYVREETDMYLIKIDGEGNEIWSHTYGGRGMDHAKMVRQASDGGYILIGSRADEFPTNGQYEADVVLIKTDTEGNEIWTRTYGDKILSVGWGVEPTLDGGYILIGWEAKTYPDRDVIAIKTNEMGDVEWSRTWDLDRGDRDAGYDLILTSDGHIVIACIQSMNSGPRRAVLVKVDLDGNEIWVKDYGEEGVGNEFWDVMEDTDGGYVMAGAMLPGEVSSTGEDIRSGLVIKTDPDGEILWQYVFEVDEYEQLMFSSAVVLPEGGYIFVGRGTRKGERYADMLWLKLTTDDVVLNGGGGNDEPITMTYGGSYNDRAFDVLVTDDGGMLIGGLANNTHRSHRITPGNARLIRTDSDGNAIWERDYGGDVDAMFTSIIQAGEEEYVLLGQIAASYVREETDMYLIKVDGEGNEIWSHTYGGRGMDHAKMVRQTSDGGYILIGSRADEYPTSGVYQGDIALIKTDAEGNQVWSRNYGDQILYLGWGVAQTPDGGYVLTGWEAKTIDDRDVIAIKTNEMGDVEWSRTWDLSPGERDGGFDLILTSDGYIVIACIQSMGSGAPSAVLIKLDLDGNEIWNKLIGEEGVGNTFWDIMEDSDGGYVMAGDTHLGKDSATGEDIHGGLMIKTDADGEILWQRIFGEGQYEQVSFNSAAPLPDGGYVFVGRVTRYGEAYSDMLWLKISKVIAFTSERDGEGDIYVMNADGSDPQRLTDDPAYDGWPTWSPDGLQIAFVSTRSGNPDIYVMDADGSNVQQLTQHTANDIWPAWSPDGARIAFPSRRDGNFEIYVINVDGTNLQRLTNTPSVEDFPAWSPDGSQIVFSRTEGNDGTYVMNADGSDERKLADIVGLEFAWSPDGTRIAFGSDHEGFRGIYVMNADGSNLQRLSQTRAGENCPEWSPDGTRIVFASWRDGDGEIYVMDADGSNLQKLTDNRFEEEFPAWRPAPGLGTQ
jgi:Tol biopolymer transport system component